LAAPAAVGGGCGGHSGGWNIRSTCKMSLDRRHENQQQQQEGNAQTDHTNSGNGSSSESPECNPDISELFAQLTDDMRQNGMLPSAEPGSQAAAGGPAPKELPPTGPIVSLPAAAGTMSPGSAALNASHTGPTAEGGCEDVEADVEAALQAAAVFAWADMD
jgi:hypothetical protein